ncbi:MAG: hypothetical protein P1U65_04585 [Minwuia sp.]|nr:hypothetical protein [Minwuia sp.]
MNPSDPEEILLEYVELKGSVRATAIHVATGIEVSIVGPSHAGEPQLRRNVLARLRYVMRQKSEQTDRKPDNRPGLLV